MSKQDIYEEVTNNIIQLLEQVDPDDYQAPFAGLAAQGLPLNPTTENRYQGINILSLWFNQQSKNFTSNQWATFKQWKDNGAQVKKGEKGSRVIFYKTLLGTQENGKGESEEIKIPMLKLYTVFNANQVEGYDHHESGKPSEEDLVTKLELAEQFCRNTKAEIRHGGNGAYYHRVEDYINIPETKAFVDTKYANATENYYATLMHELTHWTGSPTRLDRDKAKTRKELEKYAFEELVAELGAAFLCAQLNITQTTRQDHALYLKGWLQALKDDKKYIFTAAAQAAKAGDFLNKLQPE